MGQTLAEQISSGSPVVRIIKTDVVAYNIIYVVFIKTKPGSDFYGIRSQKLELALDEKT